MTNETLEIHKKDLYFVLSSFMQHTGALQYIGLDDIADQFRSRFPLVEGFYITSDNQLQDFCKDMIRLAGKKVGIVPNIP